MTFRGLFQSIFGGGKPKGGNFATYRLLSSYDSSFTPFSGKAWDIGTVRAAVDAWARRAAKIQPRHIRRAGGRREDVPDHINRILQIRPNPYMTAAAFYYKVAAQYVIYNNAFILPVFDAGRLTALYPKLYEAFVEAFGEVGLGLGSEISQISAVFVASPIDHYLKDTLGIKGDGRYMDDGYIIHESMDVLRKCLAKLRELTEKMGLKLNEKKTKIVRLTRQFRFLKMRIYLSETGAVVRRLARENITKRRRQLRKFRAKLEAGKMTLKSIVESFVSWLGHAKRARSYKTIKAMRKLFASLFGKENLPCLSY